MVLHLISGRSFTGPAASALLDVRALLATGIPAGLGSRSGTALESGCRDQNVPFTGGFKLGRGLASLLRLPADVKHLRRVSLQNNVNVLHLHRSTDVPLARWAFGRRKSRPLIIRTWHRTPHPATGVDACVCVSSTHEQLLQQAGMPARYIPAGVDTDCFKPAAAASVSRCMPGLDQPLGQTLLIGLIGRWKSGEDRGQRAMLELAKNLPSSIDWRIVLLGRGEGRADLENLRAQLPHKERIHLVETAPGPGYADQVRALDVGLVFATGSDGASRPAVELLASGVPIFVAPQPGLQELAAPCAGITDLPVQVLSPNGPHAAAVALQHYSKLTTAEQTQRRTQARALALQRHALAIRGAALRDWYQEVRKKGSA